MIADGFRRCFMLFAAVDRTGMVLGIGYSNDDAIADAGLQASRVWRIYPCDQDVLACFAAGNDVLIRIENGLAVI